MLALKSWCEHLKSTICFFSCFVSSLASFPLLLPFLSCFVASLTLFPVLLLLRRPGAVQEGSWGRLGASWGLPGGVWEAPGGVLGPPGEGPGGVWGPSWKDLGSHLAARRVLERFWLDFGAVLGAKREPKSTQNDPRTRQNRRRISGAENTLSKIVLGASRADFGSFRGASWNRKS